MGKSYAILLHDDQAREPPERALLFCDPRPDIGDPPDSFRVTGYGGPFRRWSDPVEALAVVLTVVDDTAGRYAGEVVEVVDLEGGGVVLHSLDQSPTLTETQTS